MNVTWSQLVRPGKKDFGVYTIDQYDQWQGMRTQSAWDAKQAASAQSLRGCIAQATADGVMFGIDECGPVHKTYGAGDNPQYFISMLGEITKTKEITERCAWWSLYNHQGAPPDMYHDIAHNPRAYDELARRFAALRAPA